MALSKLSPGYHNDSHKEAKTLIQSTVILKLWLKDGSSFIHRKKKKEAYVINTTKSKIFMRES